MPVTSVSLSRTTPIATRLRTSKNGSLTRNMTGRPLVA
jgi:hypothetical protein